MERRKKSSQASHKLKDNFYVQILSNKMQLCYNGIWYFHVPQIAVCGTAGIRQKAAPVICSSLPILPTQTLHY